MSNESIHFVGKRIKEIRLQKELKLVDLALKSGISKGLLSRIENGRTIPSLPVLFNIITTLNENPGSFFETLDPSSNSPLYMLLKKEEYKPLEKEDSVGFNYFSIFSRPFGDFTFNAVLLLLEPNAKREMVTTDGMEFIYLVSGNIEYKLRWKKVIRCFSTDVFLT